MYKIITILAVLIFITTSCDSSKSKMTRSQEEILGEKIHKAVKNNQDLDSNTIKQILELTKVSEDWQTIHSKKGNFKIKFPNYKVEEKKTIQVINDKDIEINHFNINTQKEDDFNLAYAIYFHHIPEIKGLEQINQTFNSERNQILRTINGTILQETKIDTLDFPGRHLFLAINGSETRIYTRMYIANGIFYKLIVITRNENYFNSSINKFMNSFELLN